MKLMYKILILLAIIVLIVGFIYLCNNRFLIPHGRIENIVAIDENRACILYEDGVAGTVYKKLALIDSEKNRVVWSIDVPTETETFYRGLRISGDIITLRFYTLNQAETQAAQKIAAYSVTDGKKLWESDPVIVQLKYPEQMINPPMLYFAYQDDSLLFENFKRDSDACVLMAINLKDGQTLWQKDKDACDFYSYQVFQNSMLLQSGFVDGDLILEKRTGKIKAKVKLPLYAVVIDTTLWCIDYDQNKSLFTLDLTTMENKKITEQFSNSYKHAFEPLAFARYHDKYFCLLSSEGFKKRTLKIMQFSPKNGEVLWDITLAERGNWFFSRWDVQHHSFSNQLTRYIALPLRHYDNDNSEVYIIDLKENKLVNTLIWDEKVDFNSAYRYDTNYVIFNIFHSQMISINGNTGDYSLYKIPFNIWRFFPSLIKENNFWLFNSGSLDFPVNCWQKYDYMTGRLIKKGDAAPDRGDFEDITTELQVK